MVGLNKKHKRLHKALACALRCDHFQGRFVTLGTAETILNELAPAGKTLPKAFLENGALNNMEANYMLAVALNNEEYIDIPPDIVMAVRGIRPDSSTPRFYVVGVFSSIDDVPDNATIRDLYRRGGAASVCLIE